jgi:hypothetical protein
MSVRFGGDCTKSALENRFRRIKSDAERINEAVRKGIDPIVLNVGDTDRVAIKGGKSGYGQTLPDSHQCTLHIPFCHSIEP